MADKSMVFKIGARDDASSVFGQVAAAATALEKKLDDLGRKHAKPKVTLDSEAAHTRVTALAAALKEIKNQRARVDVDLGTATADVGDLRRELSYFRDVKVKVRVDAGTAAADMAALGAQLASFRDAAATLRVRVDSGTAEADMAALGAQIASFRDARIKVEVVAGTARVELAAIARAARRLSGVDGQTIRLKIEVDAGNSVAELTAIATLLREVRGTTRARVQVDTSSGVTAVARLASGLGSLFKVAGGGLAIPGLIAAVGQVGSLGASVMSLTGILGLLPAAGLAAGAALGTVAIGLQGIGDALGPTGTAAELEKVNAAMERLSPAGRELVTQIRALAPAWDGLRLDVQERLLAGLGAEVQQLGTAYLPTLKAGLGGVATELNAGVRMWSDWASSGPAVNDLNTILGNTRTTLRELAPAGTNVAAALTDISVVGSEIMPELAAGATEATARFREFIAEARRTGELEQWIRGGISTLEQLGRIAGNTGGILGSVFQASETAGYGFLDAVEQITGELDNLLSSAAGQNALVEVFRESRDAVNATLPGMRELGSATLETTGAFARSDGLERFAGLISQTATAISPLVSQLGSLAGDALGDLAGGASLAVSALTPLVGGAAAVVDGLGPIPGLVLASVVAFKGLGLATASVVALGTAITGTAALAGTLAAGLTGSLAAGAAAQAGMTRLGGAVSALGRALPLIGVAVVGLAFAMDGLSTSTSEAVDVMSRGGRAADELEASLLAQQQTMQRNIAAAEESAGGYDDLSRSVKYWVQENIFGIATLDSVNAALAEQRANMTGLERAQQDAAAAQRDYQVAVDEFGASSPQALAAARNLASATDDVEAAQRAAGDATKSHTDAMRDQVAAATSALGANIELTAAARAVADAETAANDAIRRKGAESREAVEATEALTQAAMQEAEAAKAVAIGRAQAAGSTDAAAAGQAAYAATLLNTAATLEGPARDAVLGQIATLSDAELAALSAGAAATGFATQLLTLPDGRTVTIAVDPETGEIVSTQALLDGMQDADVAITVEQQQALADLDAFIGVVNGAGGSVTIDGNPMAAGVALQTVLGQIAAGAATVTINGQTVPAATALSMILGQIEASGATVTINGQNVPAAGVLRDTLAAISAGQGTVTINGQSYPAQAVLGAILRDTNAARALMTIGANDQATPVLNRLDGRRTSSTHTIYYRESGYPTNLGRASAGYGAALGAIIPAQRFRNGGVAATAFANGGMRPFRAGTAQIFPPRLLRITGDRTDVDEFYIPDNNARRSVALGAEWARRRGMALMPRGIKTVARAVSSGSAPRSLPVATPIGTSSPGSPVAEQIRAVMAQVQIAAPIGGGMGRAELAGVRSEVAKLGDQFAAVGAAVRDARPITIQDRSGNPAEMARTTQMVLLTGRK